MAARPETRPSLSSTTTTSLVPADKETTSTMMILPQNSSGYMEEDLTLEEELDFRLRGLARQNNGEVRRDVKNDDDGLEEMNGSEVFGEDYGWECGIWYVVVALFSRL